ncbi:hypothetical protein [Flocculibacter collagenilyticus]|uniref:hypothetical protein n=1 Tax=Flocculibacter collagenilyticus TaxID=2744479 RepID=UPI0018F34957|nr:hypothetical protein [Flocculibacter collagenilyticus]
MEIILLAVFLIGLKWLSKHDNPLLLLLILLFFGQTDDDAFGGVEELMEDFDDR